MARIWFTSDIHLYYGGTDYLNQFVSFLDAASRGTDELWIVGDLFEFWIGDRQANFTFYKPLFDRLARLVKDGVPVKLIHGNRDFLMGKRFADTGVELLPEEVVLDLAGKKVHVSHGDQFCIHDRSYQRARVVMRSRPIRAIAKALPAGVGVFLARAYRGISERKKSKKKMIGGGNRYYSIEDGVKQEFARGDHDVILCGHIHHYQDQRATIAGRERRIITTGAWEEGPNYVAFDGHDLELRRFAPQT